MKLNWNFQGGGGLQQIPSVGEVHVCIFSRMTQFFNSVLFVCFYDMSAYMYSIFNFIANMIIIF